MRLGARRRWAPSGTNILPRMLTEYVSGFAANNSLRSNIDLRSRIPVALAPRRGHGILLLILAGVGAAVLPAQAQTVRLEGGERVAEAAAVRTLLERGAYRTVDRDTVLPADFSADGDLVVAGADVRLEGSVTGDVAVLGGMLFVRPGASVGGTIHTLGGGVVLSGLAERPTISDAPLGVRVRIEPVPDGYLARVIAPPAPPRFTLPGVYGLMPPTYDRVDGLSLSWEPEARLFRRVGGPAVRGRLTYRSARGTLDGGTTLTAPLGPTRLSLTAERTTRTPDRWMVGDLVNTAAALALGSDHRNYFGSDRAALELRYATGIGAPRSRFRLTPWLGAESSRDRSLPASSPWSVLGTLERENPAVDAGWLRSVTAGIQTDWFGSLTDFRGTLAVERGLGGDVPPFTLLTADGRWDMEALFDHDLMVRFRGMAPVGQAAAPRQRWSFVGGAATLPNVPVAEMRGDHLAYVYSRYRVPLRFIDLPTVGSPALRLLHATGAAWPTGQSPPSWEQNLGLGAQLFLGYLDVWVDPAADRLEPRVLAGFTMPF